MTYFNTIAETGDQLHASRITAQRQEARVLAWFQSHPGEHTPADVFSSGCCGSAPITSVRRAITTLTNDMKLTKCHSQRLGMYGKNNYVWRLAEKRNFQQLNLL
jgi:hypothetical protein